LPEPIGFFGNVIHPYHRGLAMSAAQTTSARSRRARSAEDESPLIVTLIAILGIVVLACVGLMAPVVWSAFVDRPGQRWNGQECSQEAATAICSDRNRLQAFRPHPSAGPEPLIPHL
jgi:hypothetical protein